MPKGKTPSLIGASLGRPKKTICGRRTACSRCHEDILKGDVCYDVPRVKKPHASSRRFCGGCFAEVVDQSKRDLDGLL